MNLMTREQSAKEPGTPAEFHLGYHIWNVRYTVDDPETNENDIIIKCRREARRLEALMPFQNAARRRRRNEQSAALYPPYSRPRAPSQHNRQMR